MKNHMDIKLHILQVQRIICSFTWLALNTWSICWQELPLTWFTCPSTDNSCFEKWLSHWHRTIKYNTLHVNWIHFFNYIFLNRCMFIPNTISQYKPKPYNETLPKSASSSTFNPVSAKYPHPFFSYSKSIKD